jgi:hypothetical protein
MNDEDEPSRKKGTTLPPSVTTRIFNSLRSIVPEPLQGPFREKERGLLLLERKLQRSFLNDYRAQVKQVEPILRARGEEIGSSILSALTQGMKSTTTYEQAYESAGLSLFENESSKEILQLVDPLIAPVMTPFVEGLQKPINDSIQEMKMNIVSYWALSVTASLATGYLCGRFLGKTNKTK